MLNRVALLTVLLGACSPVTFKADGGADDDSSTSDANSYDAGPGAVTVTVYDQRTADPLGGAKVAFFNKNGTLAGMHLTSGAGVATESIFPGGIIAVGIVQDLAEDGVQYRVDVVAGVNPGDNIEVGPLGPEPTYNQIGSANVNFPNGYSGATQYYAGDCYLNFTTVPGTYTHYFYDDRCTHGAGTVDLLAVAADNAGAPLAYAIIPGVIANSGTTYTAGAWNIDYNRINLSLLNAPFAGTLDLRGNLYRGSPNISYQYNGLTDPVGDVVASGNSTADVVFPPNFADKVSLEVQLRSTASDQLVGWASNLAPSAGARSINLTDDMLPLVDQVSYDAISDPGRPQWNFRINGAPEATSQLHAAFLQDPRDGSVYIITVFAPPGLPSPFKLPEIPNDLITRPANGDAGADEPAWPPPADAAVFQVFSGLFDTTLFAGYDQLKGARASGQLFGDGLIKPEAPVGALVRVSAGGTFGN